MDFQIADYESKYAADVKQCALRAWRFAYAKIFTDAQIQEYVDRFYSEENNLIAEDLISRGMVRYSVALDDAGKLVGFQSSSIYLLSPELSRLYVLPERIGSGLGTALLNESEIFFRRSGFSSFQVKVHKHNTLGQRFYERKGFLFIAEDNADHFLLRNDLH